LAYKNQRSKGPLVQSRKPPNTACSRRVGVARFKAVFLAQAGSGKAAFSRPAGSTGEAVSRSPAGNAHGGALTSKTKWRIA